MPKRKAEDVPPLSPARQKVKGGEMMLPGRRNKAEDIPQTIDRFDSRYPGYSRFVEKVSWRTKHADPNWFRDAFGLQHSYKKLRNTSADWTYDYLIDDITVLPENRIQSLIASTDGFCVQMEWPKLQNLLKPRAVSVFGEILGEILISMEFQKRLFQDPLWYLDGKSGPDD